ncbi:hypothetical protein Cob_v006432 [Colletotrichum orbiculare MAFF 240422]|uniref:SprT-like domain-containing protein n=1 Tax=Colletotrichum orbiculare (strain 104-T / ATCC 96160 / CBS 514.97 / LARS 414 / MAFF 240422) TaxID=1213857 RepID=A0A484FS00_COLOR|nr:hypothetical protein Cob_v006432 [Colletotrichum orbiculare MAFF 240422]
MEGDCAEVEPLEDGEIRETRGRTFYHDDFAPSRHSSAHQEWHYDSYDSPQIRLLFPTTHINHTSHPVFLEIGQARGRVGWTQALRSNLGPRAGPSILIRLSTVRHRDDGKTEFLTLKEVVQVAAHEMVHAYLLLLSCRREQCGADFEVMHRDADGGGHGLAFVAVLKAVLGQIQSWGPGLEEFGMTDDAIYFDNMHRPRLVFQRIYVWF